MMQLIQWQASLETRHAMIDADHKVLVDMLNKLLESLLEGGDGAALGGILDGLVEYTQCHFAREEAAMRKSGYPGMAAHLAEHEAFRQQVGEFMEKLRAGETMLTLGMMKFLRLWLTDHIMTVDQQLAAFLNG